jgi:hypothetical protein
MLLGGCEGGEEARVRGESMDAATARSMTNQRPNWNNKDKIYKNMLIVPFLE